jgi:hypothetical protein
MNVLTLTANGAATVFKSQTKTVGRKSGKQFFLKFGAITGFAGGAAAMLIGLTMCIMVWAAGLQLRDSAFGAIGAGALVASFALTFGGAFCLDAIYDAVYAKARQNRDKQK